METIMNWLLENYPWLAPTLVCCYIAWRLSRWTKRIDNAIQKIDKLPCEEHIKSIEKHEVRISKEEEDIRNSNKRMDDILIGMSMGMSVASKKRSPYQLNEFGEYILKESHGKECVDNNKDYLFVKIDSDMNSTPYDIERSSMKAVFDLFYTDMANDVKDFIYNSPDVILFNGKEYPLRQNDMQVSMAIYLRDLYMGYHRKSSGEK